MSAAIDALAYRCMVCNALPGQPCVTPTGEAKSFTHAIRGDFFDNGMPVSAQCELALDMDLDDGEQLLARYGFIHDGYGRDANTRVWVSDFIRSLRTTGGAA